MTLHSKSFRRCTSEDVAFFPPRPPFAFFSFLDFGATHQNWEFRSSGGRVGVVVEQERKHTDDVMISSEAT